MVKVLIGMSGSGKTYRIQEELIRMHMSAGAAVRDTYVIEKKKDNEYSHVFHPDFISVYKPDDSMVDSLLDAENIDIIIDCEYYSEEFMEKVSVIVKRAERNNNNVTITFIEITDNIILGKAILMDANEILVGRCGADTEVVLERLFDVKLAPMGKKFDFRKIKM